MKLLASALLAAMAVAVATPASAVSVPAVKAERVVHHAGHKHVVKKKAPKKHHHHHHHAKKHKAVKHVHGKPHKH